jgi:hypothetical protein
MILFDCQQKFHARENQGEETSKVVSSRIGGVSEIDN